MKSNPSIKELEYRREYYRQNKERILEYSRRRYRAKRDEILARQAAQKKSDSGKKVQSGIAKKMYQKYKGKHKARAAVSYALKMGRLTKPTECTRCGSESRIEGHHPDYSKPLEVLWLCVRCHKIEHGVPVV